MQIASGNNQGKDRILILADFSEGNWEAIQFAMEYLYQANSEICIVQTWQKPNFGFSMVRDLSSILQNIAENELESLKRKILTVYALSDSQIRLFPFEGDLPGYFKSEMYRDNNWHVVMASSENGNQLTDNQSIIEIIDKVGQPLYILSGLKGLSDFSDVFVLSDTNNPSNSILTALERIAVGNKISFRVCLNSTEQSRLTIEKSKRKYSDACRDSRLIFLEAANGAGKKEFNDFATENGQRIMIFDQNKHRKFSGAFKLCMNSWFIRSKGISIGNY
jgi:hypothetical protein